jgi:hypothetical protein
VLAFVAEKTVRSLIAALADLNVWSLGAGVPVRLGDGLGFC